jgi:UDP-glucose 4-epimerase
MTDERILVIGKGFLGCAVARALSQQKFRVTILSPRAESSERSGEPTVVRGSQADERLVDGLLQKHTSVIHAAWGTTPGSSAGRPTVEASVALAPWISFLETLERFPSTRILFLSSGGAIYGNPIQLPASEDSPLQPLSYHGAGKAAAELFLRTLRAAGANPPTILRPSNVYGPGQPWRTGFGVLRHLLQCVIEHKPFPLWGDGSQVRDYLYVDDFVEAVVRLIRHQRVSGTFNVGSGSGASLLELIAVVENVTGRPVRIESHARLETDVGRIVLDIGRIRDAIGWAPTTSLPEGIARMWQWLRKEA